MISKTSSSDHASGPDPLSLNPSQRGFNAPPPQPDTVSTDNGDGLRAALANQPEIRPEVVARGMALAADPDYPSTEVIGHVAAMILNSGDLSEDES